MSGQISESKINEIRERTDIVELISQYVSLKHSGANHTGLCPFHSEKTPSFSVNSARQFFHCFGCGVGGDVFSFLMKIEGLVFPDAVRMLAERSGIELEEHIPTPEEEQRERQRARLYRVNEVAAAYFHRLLMEHPAGEPARQYMKVRGYGRKASGEYQIGFSESWDGLRTHLEEQGLATDDARVLGLLRPGKQERGDYDPFRGRLIFPVHDLSGRIIAFAGRVLDDSKPKYINSPESPIYHKGRILFGLFQARQAMRQCGEVLLVEGYFDQLALYRAGFPQVVATCGTALTTDHAHLLKRYVQRVVLLFDQDSAGKKATFKAMTVLQEEGIPAAVIELPKGEDPDSFMRKEGVDAFRVRLGKARSAMDFFMADVLSEAGNGIEAKVRAAEQIVEQIAKLSSELEQDLYLKELAQRSGIDLERLRQVNNKVIGRGQQKRPTLSPPATESCPLPEPPLPVEAPGGYAPPSRRSEVKPDWSRSEETLLCLLLQNHVSSQQILKAGGVDLFNHQEARDMAQLLLDQATESGLDMATFIDDLPADKARLLMAISLLDKGQFSEGVDAVFSGCLTALQRELKKQKRRESIEKLRKFEQGGDSGTINEANNLLKQFKNLK
ncbi:DNA primase [Desulfuromusa kysingii]|uniref:DNA primase n=1 Tax=Desulfuromusa kysingii TaxID=37625 RepID=A0A1H3XCI9_9BACT|nr:DNA primase [Desulfuromusa kysingii]SDZ97097.1 DNA primase [Desulfuromusa kysingii]